MAQCLAHGRGAKYCIYWVQEAICVLFVPPHLLICWSKITCHTLMFAGGLSLFSCHQDGCIPACCLGWNERYHGLHLHVVLVRRLLVRRHPLVCRCRPKNEAQGQAMVWPRFLSQCPLHLPGVTCLRLCPAPFQGHTTASAAYSRPSWLAARGESQQNRTGLHTEGKWLRGVW